MPILTCKRVLFFSEADETAFFDFAGSIKAVRRIEGVRYTILLHVSSRPSLESVRDLAGLFRRYRISNKAQLEIFTRATPHPQ